MTIDGVWISDLNKHRFLRIYFSVFPSLLGLTEKIYQTLKTVFNHISKHLKAHHPLLVVFSTLFSLFGKWSNTLFRV